jgi:hypothetical protein
MSLENLHKYKHQDSSADMTIAIIARALQMKERTNLLPWWCPCPESLTKEHKPRKWSGEEALI